MDGYEALHKKNIEIANTIKEPKTSESNCMTVAQLIEELKKLDPNASIGRVNEDHEQGYDERIAITGVLPSDEVPSCFGDKIDYVIV